MSVVLLILGFVLAVAGTAMIGFGIPINEFTLGTTLILAGTTALSGGLVLIGLSAVVTELGRLAEGLRARTRAPAAAPEPAAPGATAMAYPASAPPPSRPAPAGASPSSAPPLQRRPEPRPVAEPPTAPTAVEVSAAAIERLRSSIPRSERRADPSGAEYEAAPLSPNGAGYHQQPRSPAPDNPAGEPAEDRAGAGDAAKRSRLDFLFRTRGGRSGSTAPQPAESPAWPDARGHRPQGEGEPPPVHEPMPRHAEAAPQERGPEPIEQARGAAILKSGVVDGMAYTLYADGSIEAKLPQGTVRFGSIAELRSHIEHNS